MGVQDKIFIVDNTPTAHSAGVANYFHDVIVAAIKNGGTLPEELADLITLTTVVVNGATRWIVDWF